MGDSDFNYLNMYLFQDAKQDFTLERGSYQKAEVAGVEFNQANYSSKKAIWEYK